MMTSCRFARYILDACMTGSLREGLQMQPVAFLVVVSATPLLQPPPHPANMPCRAALCCAVPQCAVLWSLVVTLPAAAGSGFHTTADGGEAGIGESWGGGGGQCSIRRERGHDCCCMDRRRMQSLPIHTHVCSVRDTPVPPSPLPSLQVPRISRGSSSLPASRTHSALLSPGSSFVAGAAAPGARPPLGARKPPDELLEVRRVLLHSRR
jgi:hypothetical protein